MNTGIAALAAGIASLALFAGQAAAQAFPNKPVKLVVPYGAGGAPDGLRRAAGQRHRDRHGGVRPGGASGRRVS